MARVEHIDWLETFVAVVDNGGFSAAAETIHRSQSRVSSHVAALEQAIGTRLFDRRHRPVLLTDAGHAYLPHAREVLAALGRGQAEIDAVLGVMRGSVVLGSYPSASAAFVPGLVRSFAELYPEVRIELTEQATLGLEESLTSGAVHLAIRAVTPEPHGEGLSCRRLWHEPLVAVFGADHPLASAPRPVPLALLAEHDLVTIGGRLDQPVRYEAHRALEQTGAPYRIAWQTDQPQTLVNFVRNGLGVGVTNALAVAISDTAGLVTAQVGELELGRTVGVFWDSRRYLPRAAHALLEEILVLPVPAGTSPVRDRSVHIDPIRSADDRHS